MKKIMLIDDEPIIREGMYHIIDWERYDFKIVGDYGHATAGLEAILTHKPDLVFVDIRMPNISGIELVKQAQDAGYDGYFIILSGYSNFDYAKESIKLGVFSYLLKPIDEDELIECLLEVKQEMRKKEAIDQRLKQYQHQSEHEVWRAILEGRMNDWQTSPYVKDFRAPYTTALIFVDQSLSRTEIKSFFEAYHKDKLKIILKDNVLHCIFVGFNDEAVRDQLKNLMITIRQQVDEAAYSILEKPVEKLDDLAKVTKRLHQANHHVYIRPKQTIYFGQQLLDAQEVAIETPIAKEEVSQRIVQALEFKDRTILNQLMSRIIRDFQERAYERDQAKSELLDLVMFSLEKIKAHYPNLTFENKNYWFDLIQKSDHLFHVMTDIEEKLWDLHHQISGFSLDGGDNIEKILAYVNQYYMEELNLKVLADLFSYNSSYLGKKFKKHTGEYFHHYLEKVRIEKAKQILADEKIKIYQVSEAVGYNNMDYFYKKFKKYVGMSPKEYQKKRAKEQAHES